MGDHMSNLLPLASPTPMPAEFLTEKQAASFLLMSRSFLQKARHFRSPGGPPYVKIGSRSVRYSRADLVAWIASRKVQA